MTFFVFLCFAIGSDYESDEGTAAESDIVTIREVTDAINTGILCFA